MSKKLYGALLPILAVVAFASMSGAAQAAPHWYACQKLGTETGKFTDSECQKAGKGFWEWKRLPFSETKFQVITFGKLTFTAGKITITCKVIDAGNIWNPVTELAGKDNIEVFVNYECVSSGETVCSPVGITAKGLPWATELIEVGGVKKDSIKGIKVTVLCGTTELTFEGELTPNMVNPTEVEPLNAEFTATTGELEEPATKLKAKVTGKDRILGFEHGEQLKVENP